jgi:beta-lactamase class A
MTPRWQDQALAWGELKRRVPRPCTRPATERGVTMTNARHETVRRLTELSDHFSGRLGIAARHLGTGEELAVHADESFPTASSIKIAVLIELYRQAQAGELSLRERQKYTLHDRTLGSGLLSDLDEGLEPTLRDLAVLMMAISDNTATNMLIDRLGKERINATLRGAGITGIELRNRIDFDLIRQSNDNLAVGTPMEFVRLMTAVWEGRILASPHRDGVLRIMRIQKYIEPIRRFLPFNPYAVEFGQPQDLWIASKTGGLSGVRCESGLIGTGDTVYALSVMGKDSTDKMISTDSEGTLAIATASELVYRYWVGDPAAG